MQQRWIVLIVVLGVRAAHAQPSPDLAAAAYQEARRLYDIKEWDQAIAKFKEAYRLRPEARSLFNIAQAYRLKGDCVEAVSFYKTFKRNYPAEQTAKVDRFLVELEPCAKQQAAARPEPTPAVTPPPDPPPLDRSPTPPALAPGEPAKLEPAKPVPSNLEPAYLQPGPRDPQSAEPPPAIVVTSPGRTQRIVGLTIAGAGVVAVATGVVFGLKARGLSDDAESGSGAWVPGIERDGERAERNAFLLWGVGGAAILGGSVLYFLGHRRRESPLSVVPTHDGASLVWACEL